MAWLLTLLIPWTCTASELVLRQEVQTYDAWDAISLRADATHTLTLADVRREEKLFQPPTGPRANLGPRDETIWLHLPLRAEGDVSTWIFDINYAPIQEAEVFLLQSGEVVKHASLGASVPLAKRPLPSRSHALPLALTSGQTYDLYLRIRTPTAVVLPIALMQASAYQIREYLVLFNQGMIAGVALALLIYGLMHRWSLKDALFAYYALILCGSAIYFLTFFGLPQQFIWATQTPLTMKAGPMGVLLALTGGGHFVTQALGTRHRFPILHFGLKAVAWLSLGALLATLVGALDYGQTQVAATIFGPAVMLFAIPAAWLRARSRDQVGIYMLIGWSCYMLGAIATAALLRGYAPANWWTLHLMQIGWLIEMFAWIRVLGLNIATLRATAQKAEEARQSLESQALTDALTGLPNRRALDLMLARALTEREPQGLLVVYLLDLDGFKAINDRFGHGTGDAVLIQVCQRLRQQLRQSDFLSRHGGDEFVLVAQHLPGEPEAERLGRKLIEAIAGQLFEVDHHECPVGLTVGYALAPRDGEDAETLLRRADQAMYAGKQAGRNRLQVFAA